MLGCKQKGKKITFPIHMWDGEGDIPIGSAGAQSDLHKEFCLLDHTFSANSKTETLEIWMIQTVCV